MKKRIVAILLCAMLVFTLALASCSSNGTTSAEESKPAESQAPADESSEAPVEESSEAPADESSEAPADESSEAPVEESSEAPAEESSEPEDEPDSYFWFHLDEIPEGNQADLTFKVPGEILDDGDVTFTALVYFDEDIQGSGFGYVNCYSYFSEENYRNFDYLICWNDFATSSNTPRGVWKEVSYTCNPYNHTYGSTKVESVGGKATPEFVALGVGFYNGYGTVKVARLSATQDGEEIWSIDFADGPELEEGSPLLPSNQAWLACGPEDEGTVWGVEAPNVVIEVSDDEPSEEPSEPADEEPEGYLWLKGVGDDAVDPSIHFKVPGSLIKDAPITIKALVKFSEDCQPNNGCVFLNMYSYEQDEIDDFTYLITFVDYAKDTTVEKGKWVEIDTSDPSGGPSYYPNLNPHDGTYDSYAGKKVDPAVVTLGIGFYLASGTIYVGYISVEQDGEEIWGIDFSEGFDVDDSDDLNDIAAIKNMNAETKDVTWGSVTPVIVVDDE